MYMDTYPANTNRLSKIEIGEIYAGRMWLGKNPDFRKLDKIIRSLDSYGCRISVVDTARWEEGAAHWESPEEALALKHRSAVRDEWEEALVTEALQWNDIRVKRGKKAATEHLVRRIDEYAEDPEAVFHNWSIDDIELEDILRACVIKDREKRERAEERSAKYGDKGYVLDFYVMFLDFEWAGLPRGVTPEDEWRFDFPGAFSRVLGKATPSGEIVQIELYDLFYEFEDVSYANAYRLLKWHEKSDIDIEVNTKPRTGTPHRVPFAQVNRDNPDAIDAYAELEALVGLEDVKEEVEKILALIEFSDVGSRFGFHMCFTGSPGTGKTEVARLIAQILAKKRGNSGDVSFLETTRADLIGRYVGETPEKTRKLLERARGGVLFIDEAYSLVSDYAEHTDYGEEALAEIIQFMEKERGNTIVIMAGYKDAMNKLFNANEGLRSRMRIQVHFPDYKADELMEIADIHAETMGFELTKKAHERLSDFVEHAYKTGATRNGNGRFIRNLLEEMEAQRCLSLARARKQGKEVSKPEQVGVKHVDNAISSAPIASALDNARGNKGPRILGFTVDETKKPPQPKRKTPKPNTFPHSEHENKATD